MDLHYTLQSNITISKEYIIWTKHAHILTLVLFILPTCTPSSIASVISIQTICSAWEMNGFTRVWRMLVVIYGLAFTHRFVCLNSQQLHPENVPAQNWKEWLNHQSILTLCHWKKKQDRAAKIRIQRECWNVLESHQQQMTICQVRFKRHNAACRKKNSQLDS